MSSPSIRQTKHYFKDGSAIFLVENVLYNLHASLLECSSVVLRDMFEVPPLPPPAVREGLTDDYPIRLTTPVTIKKFHNLLTWFYSLYTRISVSILGTDDLEDILEMSTYLRIETGREFASSELERRNLSPVTKFVIARKYHLTGWISGAVRVLISTPPHRFSVEECEALGARSVYFLDRARSQLDDPRLAIALKAPRAIHDVATCNRTKACAYAWEAEWQGKFGNVCLHPVMSTAPHAKRTQLHDLSVSGVGKTCLQITVDSILSDDVLEKQEKYVLSAISDLS